VTSAPAIVRTEREAWLAERRKLIGASEVAAILGVDPRMGPLAVYASKVSDTADVEETRWMKWGRRVEGAIADGYADETGRPVVDCGAHEIRRHPYAPFLGATLDRLTGGSLAHPEPIEGMLRVPLEAKAVAGFKAKEWAEDPPLHYQVQLQAQLACTGAQWGSLVALIGGISLAWRDLLRNDAFLAAALPKLEEFWLRVERRQPPDADGLPGTTAAVRALWSEEDGETVPLDVEALELVSLWEKAKAIEKGTEDEIETLGNRLRARMGSASFGALPDGSMLTLRTTKRAGYTVQPTEYRALRRWWPKLLRRG